MAQGQNSNWVREIDLITDILVYQYVRGSRD